MRRTSSLASCIVLLAAATLAGMFRHVDNSDRLSCLPTVGQSINSTTIDKELSVLMNSALNSTNNTRPWYETWTPNAPANLTTNATLQQIWITGVTGTALRTTMSVLVSDTIQAEQVCCAQCIHSTHAHIHRSAPAFGSTTLSTT